ncbi:MAG: hypothetical protein Q9163_000045 [Psora crenata]
MFTTTPFFPHLGGGPWGAFGNDLFRFVESATADMVPSSSQHAARRSFSPRFDVREARQEYQVQGELPGIEQKDLDIEFVDEHTLVIRGHSVKEEETRSHAPGHDQSDPAVAAAAEAEASGGTSEGSDKSVNYRKASVEEGDEEEYVDAGAEAGQPSTKSRPVSATSTGVVPTRKAEVEPSFKYWVSERAVGEFERRFTFPRRVNQEEVKASLKNGILSVVVPKLVAPEARKIEIQ